MTANWLHFKRDQLCLLHYCFLVLCVYFSSLIISRFFFFNQCLPLPLLDFFLYDQSSIFSPFSFFVFIFVLLLLFFYFFNFLAIHTFFHTVFSFSSTTTTATSSSFPPSCTFLNFLIQVNCASYNPPRLLPLQLFLFFFLRFLLTAPVSLLGGA